MEKQSILVVDDEAANIELLSSILREKYKVRGALNGDGALAIVHSDKVPDLILLDVMMPGIDGYELIKQLKQDPRSAHIPVIFVTSQTDAHDEEAGLRLGAVDYIVKPVVPAIVEVRVGTALALHNQNRELERKVKERTAALEDTRLEIIRRLGKAAEYKDNETGMHVIRMSYYSRLIAERISDDERWLDTLFYAAPMHDIGKIGIPDSILLKPGRLDKHEWQIMKRHAEYGGKIIGDHDSDILAMAKEIAENHHEKWDGSGYPRGLKAEDIPLSARVIAIADVFDALTSARPYKQAWSLDDAIRRIKGESGSHFDPSLVPIFLDCMPEILEIRKQYSDNAED